MQGCVTLCNLSYNLLAVKKRRLNRWWGGQIGAQNSLVNQAGQWAFPWVVASTIPGMITQPTPDGNSKIGFSASEAHSHS
jgi:hypothetical protein